MKLTKYITFLLALSASQQEISKAENNNEETVLGGPYTCRIMTSDGSQCVDTDSKGWLYLRNKDENCPTWYIENTQQCKDNSVRCSRENSYKITMKGGSWDGYKWAAQDAIGTGWLGLYSSIFGDICWCWAHNGGQLLCAADPRDHARACWTDRQARYITGGWSGNYLWADSEYADKRVRLSTTDCVNSRGENMILQAQTEVPPKYDL